MITIDWDNYVVIEAEDYELWELEEVIEAVREDADNWRVNGMTIPEDVQDLLEHLAELEEEYYA